MKSVETVLKYAVAVLMLLSWTTWLQAQTASNPSPSAQVDDDSQQPGRPVAEPDSRPLTGAQEPGLGSPSGFPKVFLPSFRFSQSVDSNPGLQNNTSTTNFGGVSLVGGTLELQHKGKRNELITRYDGAAVFYTGQSATLDRSNTHFHNLGFTDSFSAGRWGFMLGDEFSYAPESAIGYAPTLATGLGFRSLLAGNLFGGNLVDFNPQFLPNQTILTSFSSRISNSVIGQVQYNRSPRTAITATGSYGVLHFLDGDLLNSRQIVAGAGYNRALTRRDSIALSYDYAQFQYSAENGSFDTHSGSLMYSRRLAGRLSMTLGAGGIVSRVKFAVFNTSQANWVANANLRYLRARNEYLLTYMHGITGGSGVLLGARTDMVQAGVSRRFSRNWSGSASAGYAHNVGLQLLTHSYDSEIVNLNVSRELSRTVSMYFGYAFQNQTSNVSKLIDPLNGFLRHAVTIGFDWHLRPISLE